MRNRSVVVPLLLVLLVEPVSAWAPHHQQPTQHQRDVAMYGGRAATPLGRTTTPAGKRKRVESVTEDIDGATLLFAFDGAGLDVKIMDDLRVRLPEPSTAKIVKNTLMSRAGAAAGWSEATLDGAKDILAGSSFWVFSSEDMRGTLKAYDEWNKEYKLEREIKGGIMEGSVIDNAGVKAVVDLPTKEELMARLAGAINMAGAQGLATSINNVKGNPQGLAVRLKKAAGGKLATALKISIADEEKNPNK